VQRAALRVSNSVSTSARTKVYAFSGTGNSLAVARVLARRLDAQLVSIRAEMDRERVIASAEAIGLVFPVYHKSIPMIL
jgi:hypothetical protein